MSETAPLQIDNADQVLQAIQAEDPLALARRASEDQLRHLKSAEELLSHVHERKRRHSRAAGIAQMLVGYVALAGFFANAFQNWANQKQAEERAKTESERWTKEFKRAQDADRYRAFFETSSLVTDSGNPDRRMVGYALLKEFVNDKDYSSKAIFMLEESLALELRNDGTTRGIDDQHRHAIIAILDALSHTSDCSVLAQSTRTIDKLIQRRRPLRVGAGMATPDVDGDDSAEVFELFVQRLVGRAAQICSSERDFREVRRPIKEVLQRVPALGRKTGKLTNAEANRCIAEILHQSCTDETQTTAINSECAEVEKGYIRLCAEFAQSKERGDETSACQVMKAPGT
jgi:hypothetical protein